MIITGRHLTIRREPNTFWSSSRVECALEICPITRSRVGDTRKLSPTYDNMDIEKDIEKGLPSQGDFGTPRDRQSGEPET